LQILRRQALGVESAELTTGGDVDRRTRRVWWICEAVGLLGLLAASIFLDMKAYGTFMVVSVAVIVIGLLALAFWAMHRAE
jgi:hypothetical protein